MADNHNHSEGSPYKLLNELEKTMQDNYSAIVLNLSKVIMTEVNKEIKGLKENEILKIGEKEK